MESIYDNNTVNLIGRLDTLFEYSQGENGERIFSNWFCTERKSGVVDRIPITISEKVLNSCTEEIYKGKVKAIGYIISHTKDGKLVFNVRLITIAPISEGVPDYNVVRLTGVVASKINCRQRMNDVTVCDFLLNNVNCYGLKSYIPVIAWNERAYFISKLSSGTALSIKGRIQSRKFKINVTDSLEDREAFEISIFKVRKLKTSRVD